MWYRVRSTVLLYNMYSLIGIMCIALLSMYSPVYFPIGDMLVQPPPPPPLPIAIMCTVLWYNMCTVLWYNMHSPIGICSPVYTSMSTMVIIHNPVVSCTCMVYM